MGLQKNIRQILFICIWVLAGTGIVVLLIAAVNSRKEQVCKGFSIRITGAEEDKIFMNKNDIENVLTANKSISLNNKPVESFDLNKIELRLKNELWIRDAELFFDNNNVLKINITEREPIARIFNVSGDSFYIDSTGQKLPLSDKLSARVPVFTNYPYTFKKSGLPTDKRFVKQIKDLSLYL